MADQGKSVGKQEEVGAVRPSEAKTGSRRFFRGMFTPEERSAPFCRSWMASNTSFVAPPPLSSSTKTEDVQTIKMKRYRYESFLKDRWTMAIDSLVRSCHNASESPDLKPSNISSFMAMEEMLSKWFKNLLERHSEDARAYHTLVHLEEIFGYLELLLPSNPSLCTLEESQIENENDKPDTNQNRRLLLQEHRQCIVAFATFFHDAIYDPRSGTNEVDSAELFQKFVTELLSPLIDVISKGDIGETKTTPHDDDSKHENLVSPLKKQKKTSSSSFDVFKEKLPIISKTIVDTVIQIIHATKSHSAKVTEEKVEIIELINIFLDADLSVLGKTPEAYDAYAALIRQEYNFVSKDEYCQKRAEILEKLIDGTTTSEDVATTGSGNSNASLFRSTKMKDELEQRAIDNLRREIAILRSGSIHHVCVKLLTTTNILNIM